MSRSRPATSIAATVPANTAGHDDDAIDRLLYPSGHYGHPRDVLADAALSLGEKRAILSSWASDACAIASCPPLRHPPFAARAVSFDEVMDALTALDRFASAGKAIRHGAGRSARERSAACLSGPSTGKRRGCDGLSSEEWSRVK